MRRPWVVAVLAVAAAGISFAAYPCGDKLVVLGRGVRFERINRAANPGSIVLYLNPDSTMPKAESDFHLAASLELAGHTVQTVANREELERVLAPGGTDVVLSDLKDAEILWKTLGGGASRPPVIPVLYKPSTEELAKAKQLNKCVAQAGKKKSTSLLALVDDAVGQHQKGEAGACEPATPKAST
jgi:hypothetical protein